MAVHHNAHNERVSLEEYFAILAKDPEHGYEYLNGRVYMMTGGSPDHSIIGSNINSILKNLLKGRRCIVDNSDIYFQVSERYRVCPDVAVSCDSRDRGAQDAIRYPSLVVEVLSPTTEARDRGEKSLAYRANPGIQEYLLVNSEFPIIELFRREKHGFWALYTLGIEDSLELTSIGIHFSVAEAYQDTSLVEEPVG
ncbi:MAG TPA: Uma2 family endonuclease [Ktedonobacteraceae bacterium]|nr:Uma2 family endonuclease [Ktedonobacteraceae bacterium]